MNDNDISEEAWQEPKVSDEVKYDVKDASYWKEFQQRGLSSYQMLLALFWYCAIAMLHSRELQVLLGKTRHLIVHYSSLLVAYKVFWP